MTLRTIEVSESTYQLLLKQAQHLQLTPEHFLDRLVVEEMQAAIEPIATDTMAALAAVERLTTLFADVHIDNLEAQLDDPMLALANEALDSFVP